MLIGKTQDKTVLVSLQARAEEEIQSKWNFLQGKLGMPKTPGNNGLLPTGNGVYREYAHGAICWSLTTGAHEVHGEILDKWSSLGSGGSFLGHPVSDQTKAFDGKGHYNRFQHGVVYWSPVTGAHEVHGAILNKWSFLGLERSFLGYPISDERDFGINNARFSNFEYGQIAWSPNSGASVSSASMGPNIKGSLILQGLDDTGVPLVRRRVIASACLKTNEEQPSINHHESMNCQTEEFATNVFPKTSFKLIGGAGEKNQYELNLHVFALIEGDIHIVGTAKLCDPANQKTEILEEATNICFRVLCNDIVSQTIRLKSVNDDSFRDIELTLSNLAA